MDKNIPHKLLEKAKAAGATDADITYAQSTSTEVSALNGKVDSFESATEEVIGLRFIIGKKQAVVSTSNVSEAALDKLVAQASSMAKAMPDDDHIALASEADLAQDTNALIKKLDLKDGSTAPTVEQLKEEALAVERAGLDVSKVSKSGGGWSSYSTSSSHLLTSAGFEGTSSSTSYSIGACMLAGHGQSMVREYHHESKRHRSDISDIQKIGQKAGELAVKSLGAKSVTLGEVPVVFDKKVASNVLGELASAINGNPISKGTSFLKESMGKQIFAKGIQVVDDPHMVRGLASKAYDGEGLTNKRQVIIEDGVLKTWLLDLTTASKLGLESTGNARRSAGGLPSPGRTNFYLENGDVTVDALIADIPSGFYVTHLLSHGANLITGDFSQGASGFLIEDGKITSPVHDVTVAGNLKDMFKILQPANDLEFDKGTNSPTVRINGMTVAGK